MEKLSRCLFARGSACAIAAAIAVLIGIAAPLQAEVPAPGSQYVSSLWVRKGD